MKGIPPAALPALTRMADRITFLYAEHCVVHRDAYAVTIRDARGVAHVPAAGLSVLLLGPGSTVSHQAMVLLAESGATTVWVGEKGVRYYAHGRSLARTTRLLEAQARRVSNRNERLAVARAMYSMRFPGEDVSLLTMQQLRGREGARVRSIYREESRRSGVEWARRDYRPDEFDASDPVNKALSAGNAALYGLVHAVIVSLGCAPGLGFVHTGHERAFVYDIADLYKAEVSIPVAFDVAKDEAFDIPGTTRRRMRDAMVQGRVLERCVHDIAQLLTGAAMGEDELLADVVSLWDFQSGTAVAGGTNYDSELDG